MGQFAICEQEGYGTDPLYTGLAILPYGVGLFVGPLVTAPLASLRPWLLTIGMAIQVTGYTAVAPVIMLGFDGWPVTLSVLLVGFGQGIAYPRLFNSGLGDVAPHEAGVAAGVLAAALQIGTGIGSLFFGVLAQGVGRDAYAHAFADAGQSGELAAKQERVRTEITKKAKPRGPPKRSTALRAKRYILLLSGPWWLESPRPPCGTLLPVCSPDCLVLNTRAIDIA